jgi:L-lactate dehydrogenase complex protein LldG
LRVITSEATEIAERIARFARMVEPLGVRVHQVESGEHAAVIVSERCAELGVDRALLAADLRERAAGLVAALAARGIDCQTPADAAEARDQPLGLSYATMAVAETGSVLLAEPTLADRTVGMVTLVNLVVCETGSLVESLDEAGRALQEIALRPGGGYATLITGPSRTADIEMSLTVGVQGPAQVQVLFVDNLAG